jgi:hypothetical protein
MKQNTARNDQLGAVQDNEQAVQNSNWLNPTARASADFRELE